MKLEILAALNAEREARRAAVLVTDIASGTQRLVREADIAADPLAELLAERLRMGKSGMAQTPQGDVFLSVQAPPVRILATGAVHISQALAPMAQLLGHDVVIVDPRTAFATPERFPDVPLYAEWPDEVLPKLGVDRYTAFVALTHDPKIDDPALIHALKSKCFYIGALGSRKTHAKRVERLQAAGFTDEQIGRIRAPIGLPIGAISPAEIALSIMGEITAALRTRPAPAAPAAA
jgi:xanthine dehydrogenase accessory factor